MSSKPVTFTHHARKKFTDLAELGFVVTEPQVIETVLSPDSVDRVAEPPIAQKQISQRHILRVVFFEEAESIRVITFYPARRSRYDTEISL
jgi:hypothetical protein